MSTTPQWEMSTDNDIHFPENLKLDWSKHTIGERTKLEIIEYMKLALQQERQDQLEKCKEILGDLYNVGEVYAEQPIRKMENLCVRLEESIDQPKKE